MSISELEEHLAHLKKVHGDIPVFAVKYLCGEPLNYPFTTVEVGLDIDANNVVEIT